MAEKVSVKIGSKFDKRGVNQAKQGMRDLKDDAKSSLSNIKGSWMAATAGIAAFVAAANKATKAVKEVYNAYAEQEKVERRLTIAAKNNPLLNGDSVRGLKEYASALQRTSVFGDEAIIQQQQFLASMSMSEEQIKRTMEAAVNFASTGKVTLDSAVRNLAKTYGGLTGELGELIPELKDLTAEELENGGAVDLLLEKYDGMAEQMSNTADGAVSQLNNAWGDLKETLGAFVSDELKEMIEGLTTMLETINDLLAKIREARAMQGSADAIKAFEEQYGHMPSFGDLTPGQREQLFGAWGAGGKGGGETGGDGGGGGGGAPSGTGIRGFFEKWYGRAAPDAVKLAELENALTRARENYNVALKNSELFAAGHLDQFKTIIEYLEEQISLIKDAGEETESGVLWGMRRAHMQLKALNEDAETLVETLGAAELPFTETQRRKRARSRREEIQDVLYGAQAGEAGAVTREIDRGTWRTRATTGVMAPDLGLASALQPLIEPVANIDDVLAQGMADMAGVSERSMRWIADSIELGRARAARGAAMQEEIRRERAAGMLSAGPEGAAGSVKEVVRMRMETIQGVVERKLERVVENVRGAFTETARTGGFGSAGMMATGAADPISAAVQAFASAAMQVENLNAVLNPFTTLFEAFFAVLDSSLNQTLQPLVDLLVLIGNSLGRIIKPIIDALGPILQPIITILKTVLTPIFQLLAATLAPITSILEILQPVLTLVAVAFEVLLSPVQYIADLFQWLGEKLIAFGEWVGFIITFQWKKAKEVGFGGGFSSDAFSGLGGRVEDILEQAEGGATGYGDFGSPETTISGGNTTVQRQPDINQYITFQGDVLDLEEAAAKIAAAFSDLGYSGANITFNLAGASEE